MIILKHFRSPCESSFRDPINSKMNMIQCTSIRMFACVAYENCAHI